MSPLSYEQHGRIFNRFIFQFAKLQVITGLAAM